MSEWSSRPRLTPMAGRRKPTLRYCQDCELFHRTQRHADGEEECPKNPDFRKNLITEKRYPGA